MHGAGMGGQMQDLGGNHGALVQEAKALMDEEEEDRTGNQ